MRNVRRTSPFFLAILVQVALLFSPAPSSAKDDPSTAIRGAVLRVDAYRARRDWGAPWRRSAPETVSGSAFVIAGGKLLTNAHVVHDAEEVTLEKNDGSAPALATVVAADEGCDLAVLQPKDKAFLNGIHPLDLGELPAIGANVTIYGFPIGGHELSTTAGVVSRIELHHYAADGTTHVAGQTDAAINPGNSGGPVVLGGRVAGVVFQTLTSGQNIGFFIPAPVVRHFLSDLADGNYSGFPAIPMMTEPLQSPAERKERKLPEGRSGLVVQAVANESSFSGVLAPGDVLLAIDGQRVADDGTFTAGPTRLPAAHLFDMKSIGQTAALDVWRDSKAIKATWKATPYGPWDRIRRAAKEPHYLVYAGLLFLPLTLDYVGAAAPSGDRRAAIARTLMNQSFGTGVDNGREFVVLAKVFHDPVNEGFPDGAPNILEKVNGHPIRGLADLAKVLDDSTQARNVFEFAAPHPNLEAIDRLKAEAGKATFLAAHGIPHDRQL
ncbi:MAG TPA: trypsin-like peptidase domain-containing protein [Polyangiaceae bacterium]|jgi:S1-C subfamily serine protease